MNKSQKIIGGSLISLLFVAISLFSMCGLRTQRLQTEDDLVSAQGDEQAQVDDNWLDKLQVLNEDSTALPQSSEDKETDALLNELESLGFTDETSAEESADIPGETLDRVREAVSDEIQTVDNTPAPAENDGVDMDHLLSQLHTTREVQEAAPVPEAQVTPPQQPVESQEVFFQPKKLGPINEIQNTPLRQTSDFQMLYQDALDEYYTHRFKRAIFKFRKLLLRKDAGELADNCQYWIGECYFAMGDYYQAVAEFEKVYIFTGANKLADAQLMVGVALMKAGETRQARTELSMVSRLFKGPGIKQKVRYYLNLLERV